MGGIFSLPYLYKPINKSAAAGLSGRGRKRVSKTVTRVADKTAKEFKDFVSGLNEATKRSSKEQVPKKKVKRFKPYLVLVKQSDIPNGQVPFNKMVAVAFIPRGFSFRGRFYSLPIPSWRAAFERFVQILRDGNTPGLDTIDPKYLGSLLRADLPDQVNYAYCFRNVTRILGIARRELIFHV